MITTGHSGAERSSEPGTQNLGAMNVGTLRGYRLHRWLWIPGSRGACHRAGRRPHPLARFGITLLCTAVLALLLATAAFAFNFPALTGRVVDQANVMTPQARSDVERKSKDLEDKSGIQLVVATVNSLEGSDIETYANLLFRDWKIGEAKKNNGVLLLVAPNEHKVRIEVGYGLEGTLTDALCSVIIRTVMVPRFKVNDYSGGIEAGVDAIINVLTTDSAEWHRKVPERSPEPWLTFGEIFPILYFLLMLFIVWYVIHNARGPRGRGGRRGGGPIFIPFGGGWGSGSGSGDGGGGGGFSGGGGGGGGFSGGGGSSGGGGASGGW